MIDNFVAFMESALLWILALAFLLAFPLTEFARGMASNPSEHRWSRGGLIASAIGAAMIALLVFG